MVQRAGQEPPGQPREQPEDGEAEERAGGRGGELPAGAGRDREALRSVPGSRRDGRVALGRERDGEERDHERREEELERKGQRVRGVRRQQPGDQRTAGQPADRAAGGGQRDGR
jgi:hypothetical protein